MQSSSSYLYTHECTQFNRWCWLCNLVKNYCLLTGKDFETGCIEIMKLRALIKDSVT